MSEDLTTPAQDAFRYFLDKNPSARDPEEFFKAGFEIQQSKINRLTEALKEIHYQNLPNEKIPDIFTVYELKYEDFDKFPPRLDEKHMDPFHYLILLGKYGPFWFKPFDYIFENTGQRFFIIRKTEILLPGIFHNLGDIDELPPLIPRSSSLM